MIKKIIDDHILDVDKFKERIRQYSTYEKAILRFALQLFNARLDDITLTDVLSGLDIENKKVVLAAIKFRFNLNESIF